MRLTALFSFLALTVALLGGVARADTFTVTKVADTADGACDSDCSLREAIGAAQVREGEDTIAFDPIAFAKDQTLQLELGELAISTDLTINGPSGSILRIDAQQKSRVFTILGGDVTLKNLVIANGNGVGTGSSQETYGGCVYVADAALAMERCVINRGRAFLGGGLLLLRSTLDMANCTVSSNTATYSPAGVGGQGGGINLNFDSTATLVNCTIAGNRAQGLQSNPLPGAGGGIASFGKLFMLRNSIVADNAILPVENSAVGLGGPDIVGRYLGNYNLIGDSDGLSGLPNQDDQWDVRPRFELDSEKRPLLRDNGGNTLTIALLPNSPAIDSGGWETGKDQRGAPRPTGEGPDIGAYEFDPAPIVTGVTLTPRTPYTNDLITANVTAKDPGSAANAVTLSYRWTRKRDNRTQLLPYTGATIPTAGSEIEAGDIVTVTVRASDGLNLSAPASAEVTIANSPVSITEVRLTPRAPFTNDRLVATVRATDLDKTRLWYSYVWLRNGEEVRTIKNVRASQDIIDLRTPNFNKGDLFTVVVMVSDGGTQDIRSGTARVINSAPVISLLTLAPQAPTPTGLVISTYGGRDADGDTLTRTYKWRVGSNLLKDEKGSRLDLSKYPFVKPGDVVSVELRLFDGELYSKTLTAKVTVGNPTDNLPSEMDVEALGLSDAASAAAS